MQKDWLAQAGYDAVTAMNEPIARSLIRRTQFDLILSDVRLPEGDGISLLEWLRKERKDIPFILTTEYVSVSDVVRTIKLGARDYLPKPVHREHLLELAEDVFRPVATVRRKEKELFHRTSPKILQAEKFARLVAPSDMSVMILGANGTGKESIAQTIHNNSERWNMPFVAVNCGALPRELAASLFFGHEKGAFTGADSAKTGYFDMAKGGTLFLDEVGNLALETQQMLLRAIQERQYRPIGDKSDRSFNVRIIAATNEDLEAAVSEKRFRQDLFYRLHDFGITVPPLRDCQEDILPLAEFFREIANKELECNVSGFSSEARKALLTHAWPGNVRELRQKIMGAVLQAQEGVATKEHLELAVIKPTSHVSFALRNDAEDKERIMRALKQTNGNRCAAAELLGISRATLYSKFEEYGLKYKFRQP